MYHQTSLVAKASCSSENIYSRKYDSLTMLRPWHWWYQNNPFIRQAGSRWCITILSLTTKSSTVQKTLSRKTLHKVLNHYCDNDLEHSNFFHKTFQHVIIIYHQTKFNSKRMRSSYFSNCILTSCQP